jgi:hypothetical protein
MRIYSQLEKEIIKELIAIYNEKGSVLLTDLLSPTGIATRLPSLAALGKWAIIFPPNPNKLTVAISEECCTKANEYKADCVCATIRHTVCTIALLIEHLGDDDLIVSNSPSEFEPLAKSIGSFDPYADVGRKFKEFCFLDDLMPKITEGFISNIHRPIDYISQALIEFVENDFRTREEIAMRGTAEATQTTVEATQTTAKSTQTTAEAAQSTAKSTRKLVWFTLIGSLAGPSLGALVAFLLQK